MLPYVLCTILSQLIYRYTHLQNEFCIFINLNKDFLFGYQAHLLVGYHYIESLNLRFVDIYLLSFITMILIVLHHIGLIVSARRICTVQLTCMVYDANSGMASSRGEIHGRMESMVLTVPFHRAITSLMFSKSRIRLVVSITSLHLPSTKQQEGSVA